MGTKTKLYVASVALVGIAWGFAMYLREPVIAPSMATDALLLCALALSGEFLAFLLPRSAAGSVGFIPYFAAAIVVPNWSSVATVAGVKLVSELWMRRAPIKATLNVAAHMIMELVAITVYLLLGGVALRQLVSSTTLAHATVVAGGPALIAFALAAISNNAIVTGAIVMSSGRPAKSILQANHRSTIGLDFLAAPLIFVFAWVYVAFGAMAAAVLWVPVLGLRHVARTNLELERINEELLELMVKSLEARDPYTSGHSRRVQHYSKVIARAAGLNESAVEKIGRAALLHDVGKIHEKYAAVLAKTDKLTPEEWALIQEHPVDGATLVSTVSNLRDMAPQIRGHHENWDGTGYPDGLAGELIPLASRVIRFADTIDAMTTERPYRAPMSESQVRSEIVRCRGTQFDPIIADKLLSSPHWKSLFAPPAASALSAEPVQLTVLSAPVIHSLPRKLREPRQA
jgi:hypothetical protein